jgi:hypothetical protein
MKKILSLTFLATVGMKQIVQGSDYDLPLPKSSSVYFFEKGGILLSSMLVAAIIIYGIYYLYILLNRKRLRKRAYVNLRYFLAAVNDELTKLDELKEKTIQPFKQATGATKIYLDQDLVKYEQIIEDVQGIEAQALELYRRKASTNPYAFMSALPELEVALFRVSTRAKSQLQYLSEIERRLNIKFTIARCNLDSLKTRLGMAQKLVHLLNALDYRLDSKCLDLFRARLVTVEKQIWERRRDPDELPFADLSTWLSEILDKLNRLKK